MMEGLETSSEADMIDVTGIIDHPCRMSQQFGKQHVR